MNLSRPEAGTEYSRGPEVGPAGRGGSERHGARPGGSDSAASRRRGPERFASPLAAAGLVGAALLAVAEFTPLLSVRTGAHAVSVPTLTAGAHQSYALLPVAALAAPLMLAGRGPRGRPTLLAVGVLGLVALGIALLGDLPDAQATGLVRSTSGALTTADSTPALGLYLETLGGVVLVLTAAAGVLLVTSGERDGCPSAASGPVR